MRRFVIAAVTVTLTAGMLSFVATSAPANASATTPCVAANITPLDVAAAAKLKLPNGKKKPKPLGVVAAQSFATELTSSVNTNACNEPLDADSQSSYDAILADTQDPGIDHETLRAELQGAIEDLHFYSSNWRSAHKATRAGAVCEGFENNHLQIPNEAKLAIKLGELAGLAGDDDISQLGYNQATTIVEEWATKAIDGNATSIPDLVTVLQDVQIMAGSDDVEAKVRAKLDQAALDAYTLYNKSRCRQNKANLSCFFKASQVVALLGIEPANAYDDLMYQVENARDLAKGKKLRCPLERYAFRLRWTADDTAGGKVEFNTGRIVFEVKNGKITSTDSGPLILSTNTGLKCYAKVDDGGWVIEGNANLKGGKFPYTVGGTDDGENLHLRLIQNGEWRVTGGGSLGCQLLIGLADLFYNAWPTSLSTDGLELPAGLVDYEGTDTSSEVFEPTGETITSIGEFEYKLLYPKR